MQYQSTVLARQLSSRSLLSLLLLWTLLTSAVLLGSSIQALSAPSLPSITEKYSRLPLAFEPNAGQAEPDVRFLARGNGYAILLSQGAARLAFNRVMGAPLDGFSLAGMRPNRIQTRLRNFKVETRAIRINFGGSNRSARIEAIGRLPGVSNYIIGNDRKKWRGNIPNFAKVRYRSIYPGIDLLFYGNQRELEYDLIVGPGANPAQVRLELQGSDKLQISQSGDVILHAGADHIVLHKPVVYQAVGAARRTISASYRKEGKSGLTIRLAGYDHHKPLIIDPALTYSTYAGAAATQAFSIAVDSSGSAYISGWTNSTGFPTTSHVFESSVPPGCCGVIGFVTKLSPDGSQLAYSTFVGGTTFDIAFGLAVDGSGDAFITGWTTSPDYPVTSGAFQTSFTGTNKGFVTELNPNGSALVYSTFLGGTVFDFGETIAVDNFGNAYVTGVSASPDFPLTSSAFQNFPGGAFVSKLSSDGSQLMYSSFIGSESNIEGLAVDSKGNAYVCGGAAPGAIVTTTRSFAGDVDLYVAKIDTTAAGAASLKYATYLGGQGFDYCRTVAIAQGCLSDCSAYTTGITFSRDFPITVGTAAFGALSSAIVAEFDSTGALVYSTYTGGPGGNGNGIAVDTLGRAWIAGTTLANFLTTTPNAFQPNANDSGSVFKTTDSGASFNATGWSSVSGGSPISLVVDSTTSPPTLYAGSNNAGVWKSTDTGASFSATSIASGPSLVDFSSALGTLYATNSGGISKSTDGGATFTPLPFPAGRQVFYLKSGDNPNPNWLFAGTDDGFYRSTDAGGTFSLATGLPPSTSISSGTGAGGNIFVGTDAGVYRSTDGGASFASTNLQVPVAVIRMAIDTSTPQPTIYAGGVGGLFTSTDGFNSFVRANVPLFFPVVFGLAVDSNSVLSPKPLWVGAQDFWNFTSIFSSTDGGTTFTSFFNPSQLPSAGFPDPVIVDTSTTPSTVYLGFAQHLKGFVSVISADGSSNLLSSYLTGTGQTVPRAITLDSAGNAYIVGSTFAPNLTFTDDFPTTAGAFKTYFGAPGGLADDFVSKLPNTLEGSSVSATPSSTTMLTFSSVSSGGETNVTTSTTGPTPPSGFSLGSPATYYDFTTQATYSGDITVCIDYSPAQYANPSNLSLLHYTNGVWTDVTTSNNTTTGVICGVVSSLSPFAVAQVLNPVSIEIKPPSAAPVSINLSSAGALPVAILSTSTFDATKINPASISLDGAAVRLHGKSGYSCSNLDVNGDKIADLVCQVATDQLELQAGSALAILTGQTLSGSLIQGSEAIMIVPQ
jgi:hypothetical protein